MTLATKHSDRQVDHFLLRDTTWRLYRAFIEEMVDRTVRVTYLNGTMELMYPTLQQERPKKLLSQFVNSICTDRDSKIASYGSTTYFDNDLEMGFEPDECYYIAHEARMRGKNSIDLKTDPPPDLAIEIDISHRAIKRESIYAAMKTPEVWRNYGKTLDCLVLNDSGTYDVKEFSRSFPFLRVGELKRFMDMIPGVDENTMLRAFREWVRGINA